LARTIDNHVVIRVADALNNRTSQNVVSHISADVPKPEAMHYWRILDKYIATRRKKSVAGLELARDDGFYAPIPHDYDDSSIRGSQNELGRKIAIYIGCSLRVDPNILKMLT
jgi:hypothetical protein